MRTARVKCALTRVRGTRVFSSLRFALLARCDACQINVRKYINTIIISYKNNPPRPRGISDGCSTGEHRGALPALDTSAKKRCLLLRLTRRAFRGLVRNFRQTLDPGPPQNGSRGNDERNDGHGESESLPRGSSRFSRRVRPFVAIAANPLAP